MSFIGVIGAGAWGTALAQAASIAGNEIVLLARQNTVAQEINTLRTNSKYLGNQNLSARIMCTMEKKDLAQAKLIILAVPAQQTRAVLQQLAFTSKIPVVLTAKGFEHTSLALQSDILKTEWPDAVGLVLSGPSFAVDVAKGKPTAVTLACDDAATLNEVAENLFSRSFRPYLSSDVKGVELCGGLKNIYALASGAIEGAGLGLSARSAFISRAMAEMARMVEAMGGNITSVRGLAGVGDLVLSCTSEQSRNYRFGMALGSGKSVSEVKEMGVGLAEGVVSTPLALKMAKKFGINVPLVGAVNQLLEGIADVEQIVAELMMRTLKMES